MGEYQGSVCAVKRDAVKCVGRAWNRIKKWDNGEEAREREERERQHAKMEQEHKQLQLHRGEMQGSEQGGSVSGGLASSLASGLASSLASSLASDCIVGSSMVTTSKGVEYDGQPFGCAPLGPAM